MKKNFAFRSFAGRATFLFLAIVSAVKAEDPSQDGVPLSKPPIHRYSFDGNGGGVLLDSVGSAHGEVIVEAMPEPLPYHEGSTTLVVIPDTENTNGSTFAGMMEWVAAEVDKRKIAGVLHVGDITNRNAAVEWEKARKAFDFLDGSIPYVLAAGNHDYDGTPGRLTHMNKYFKVDDQKKWPGFGGVYEEGKLENHYQFLRINGIKWLVLSLEMGPRRAVVEWANRVLTDHKKQPAIILTHAYLYYGNTRYDHTQGRQRSSPFNFNGEGADGEMLWKGLLRKHSNVMMVVCGHLSSMFVGYRKDKGDHGNLVHQMLVDYEKIKGRGFLRLLEFLPDGKTVQVRTYSPTLNEINSPVTKGAKPQRPRQLEEFTFKLEAARGESELLAAARPEFRADKRPVTQKAKALKKHAYLNGKGQLVLDANNGLGYGKLSSDLVRGRKKVSIEVWFTPTMNRYDWSRVVGFSGGLDAFYYKFRSFGTHRAELIDDGSNEDIQRKIDVTVGKPMHVVVTYDEEPSNGDRPLLCSYVNGRNTGRLATAIKLSDLKLTQGRVGPFAGKFDELRIYDYPLSDAEVRGSYLAGPNKVKVRGITHEGK